MGRTPTWRCLVGTTPLDFHRWHGLLRPLAIMAHSFETEPAPRPSCSTDGSLPQHTTSTRRSRKRENRPFHARPRSRPRSRPQLSSSPFVGCNQFARLHDNFFFRRAQLSAFHGQASYERKTSTGRRGREKSCCSYKCANRNKADL